MTAAAIPLLSALIAGCVHALEVDHMTAVTAFVSRRPHPLKAFGFGVRWALGHSVAILVAGGVLVAMEIRPPEALVAVLELAVGVMLVGIGAWVLIGARRSEAGHTHPHGTTMVGAAHGLAGTAGFLALIPAAMLTSPWIAGAYLALFGIGTMLAMGLYAAGAGLLFHRVAGGAPRLASAFRLAAGIAAVAVGIGWVVGAG